MGGDEESHGPASPASLDVNPKGLAHPLKRSKVVGSGVFQMNYLPKSPEDNKFTLN